MVRERERKRGDLKHLSVHQWNSLCHPWFTTTNLSYRFSYLFLKLPPPPCAVLLVWNLCSCTLPPPWPPPPLYMVLVVPLRCGSFIWNSHSEPPTGPRPSPTVQVWIGTRTASRQQALDPALDPPSTAPTAQISFEICTASRPQAFDPPHCASFIWNSHSDPHPNLRPPPTAQVSFALRKIHVMPILMLGAHFWQMDWKEMEADHRRAAPQLGREKHGTQLRLSQLARKQNYEDPTSYQLEQPCSPETCCQQYIKHPTVSKEEVTSLAPTHNQQQTTFQ